MEDIIIANIFKALCQIQQNKIFYGKHENVINDGLRDRLSMVFECSDQTRQGESETEIDSGVIDLLIKKDGIPVAIIEALRLEYLDKNNTKRHINKVLIHYDQVGCTIVNVVIYGLMDNFSEFWRKYSEYLSNFQYPYEVIEPFQNIDCLLAESRHGKVVLLRQDKKIFLHLFSIHMRNK